MSATLNFLGHPITWPQAHCRLLDVHALWGGRAVYVWGTVNPMGQALVLAKWAGQKVERFDRIYAELSKFAQLAEGASISYQGPFDWQFEPQPV